MPTPEPMLADPLGQTVDVVGDLSIRGCLGRSPTERERLAGDLYGRLHPAMAALGLLFLVVILGQSGARDGTTLHGVLLGLSWVLWAVFVLEYLLRAVIAPSLPRFLKKTWWQLLFLAVPFLTMARALLMLRVARPTRVAVAALRGSRSARMTLTGRTAWLGMLTTIVVFAAADVLHSGADVRPYGKALHAAAMAAITGEPIPSDSGLAEVLDVALAIYAVVLFATLAGVLGSYFVEHRNDPTPPDV